MTHIDHSSPTEVRADAFSIAVPGGISLEDYIEAAGGAWRDRPGGCAPDLLRLSDDDDVVTLRGPLDINVTNYAEHEMTRADGMGTIVRQPTGTYDLHIPAGHTWTSSNELVRLAGVRRGSTWIRPCRPTAQFAGLARDLPDDFGVVPYPDVGRFFPSPCDPCEGLPVRTPPGDCGPALAVPPAAGGCVRPRFFDGMFITSEDLETQLRYLRLKLKMHNRATGSGVVWGLDVNLRGEDVVVSTGYAIDTCGNDLTVACDYVVPARTLMSDPLVCREPRECYALFLEYHECAQDPRPVHGDGCGPIRTACEASRIRETVRLRLVPPRQVPDSPLVRLVRQLEELLPTGREELRPEAVAAPGAADVSAPPSVPVPFTVRTTLGTHIVLQPDRRQEVTGGIDPVETGEGSIALRIVAAGGTTALTGSVRTDAGQTVATVDANGAFWTASYGKTNSFHWSVDWSTGGRNPLRGTTVILVNITGGEQIEGVVVDPARDSVLVRFPDGHGIVAGDRIVVDRADGSGNTYVLSVTQVDGELVTAAKTEAQVIEQRAVARSAARYRLTTRIVPTRVLMRPTVRELPCCGSGCCPEHDTPGRERRLVVLLLALLYGRLVQQAAAMTGDVDPTLISMVQRRIRTILGVSGDDARRAERLFAALYRAWCGAAIYAGPTRMEPDGVVIGCVTVRHGAIRSIDPLDGRRWVVHQPLIDHWAAQFGFDPLDRRVMDLFEKLCCLTSLPGFGDLLGRPTDIDEIDDASGGAHSPIDSLRRVGAVRSLSTAAGPGLSAIGTGALSTMSQIPLLDFEAIVEVVDQFFCPTKGARALPSNPERGRLGVAEAVADLPARSLPRVPLRNATREMTGALLRVIPTTALVEADDPVALVLADVEIESIDDLLTVETDALEAAAWSVVAPERVRELVGAAADIRAAAALRIGAAIKSSAGLTTPAQLRDPELCAALADEVATALAEDGVTVEASEIARALSSIEIRDRL